MKKCIVLAAIALLVGCQKSESKQSSMEKISPDSQKSKNAGYVSTDSAALKTEQINVNPSLSPITTPSVSSVFLNNNLCTGRKIIHTANIKTKVANTEEAI